METKWTKGPWSVDGNGDNLTVFMPSINGHPHRAIAISNDIPTEEYVGTGVAMIVWPEEDDSLKLRKEMIANADLISAAPELYEALEKALKTIEDDNFYRQEEDKAKEKALYRAVLAKARGKSKSEPI